jgi:hypothetical protein
MKKLVNLKIFGQGKNLHNKFNVAKNFTSFSTLLSHDKKFRKPLIKFQNNVVNLKHYSSSENSQENQMQNAKSQTKIIPILSLNNKNIKNNNRRNYQNNLNNKSDSILLNKLNNIKMTMDPPSTPSAPSSTNLSPPPEGELAKFYESFYDDPIKLKTLFESTNCKILMAHYELLSRDMKQNKLQYKYTVGMYVEFITNRHDVIKKFIFWLEPRKEKIDRKYGILILEYYIDQTDLSKLDYMDISDLADMVISHFKQKNYKLLDQLERSTLATANDSHPNAFSMIIKAMWLGQWKVRDEYFGELLCKIALCNISKFNYNAYVVFLIESVNFEKTRPYLYKFLEDNILGRFKKLYKSKSVERIAEGFSIMHGRYPGEFNNVLHACAQYLTNVRLQALQMGEVRALSILFNLGFVDPNRFMSFNISVKERKILYPRVDAPSYAAHFMAHIKILNQFDHICLNKVYQSLELMLKGNLGGIWGVLSYLHQIDFLKYVDFKLICKGDEEIEYFRTLEGGYYKNLEMLHLISRSEIKILKLLDEFCYFNRIKFEEYFLSVVMYLNKYRIDKDSEMYKRVFEKFKDALIFLNDKELKDEDEEILNDPTHLLERYSKYDLLKVKILSLPLYMDLLDGKLLEEFIDAHQVQIIDYLENGDVKYYPSLENNSSQQNSEYLMFSLMVLRLFKKEESGMSSFPCDEILVDIHSHKSEIFNMIKEFSCLSLEELHQKYKFDKVKIRFYSSLYERNILK